MNTVTRTLFDDDLFTAYVQSQCVLKATHAREHVKCTVLYNESCAT